MAAGKRRVRRRWMIRVLRVNHVDSGLVGTRRQGKSVIAVLLSKKWYFKSRTQKGYMELEA